MKKGLFKMLLLVALFVPWATSWGQAVTTFPYTTGFELGDDTNWTFVNNSTNAWYIGDAVSNTGTEALYISNDGGTSNSYTNSTLQVSYAYRTFTVDQAGQMAISFDWQCYGESNYDYLRAWIAPSSFTFTAGQLPDGSTYTSGYTTTTPTGWIDLGGKMNLYSQWQNQVSTFSIDAGTYNLVFMWANDGSAGTQPPAAIDNVQLTQLTCPQPINLSATPTTGGGVDLSWVENGSATQWLVAYDVMPLAVPSAATNVEIASDTAYALSGLADNTIYYIYVASVCGAGDTSFWTSTIARTACAAITPIPYTTGFEYDEDGDMPACWTRYAEGTSGSGTFPSAYVYSYNAHSGNVYFEMESSTGQTETAALPTVVNNGVMMELNFWTGLWSYEEPLFEVGYMDDSLFVPIDTITNMPIQSYTHLTLYLPAPSTTDITYAFRTSHNNSYTLFIDDLTLREAPNCLPISNIRGNNPSTTSVDLTWTPGDEESSWNIAYDTVPITDFSSATTTTAYDTTTTVDNLDANTTYYFYVQSDCGSDQGEWVGPFTYATAPCDGGCYYYVNMADSYGDGWNGNYIYYAIGSTIVDQQLTINSGSSAVDSVFICPSQPINFYFSVGSFTSEVSFTITNAMNEPLYTCSDGSSLSNGNIFFTTVGSCSSDCPSPNQLVISNATTSSLDLTWNERGDATQWNIAYDTMPITDFSNANIISVGSNPYTITNLDSLTTYYIYLQADCGSDSSIWVSAIGRTTLCDDACSMVVDLASTYSYYWSYAEGTITVEQMGRVVEVLNQDGHYSVPVCPNDTITFSYSDVDSYYSSYLSCTVSDVFQNILWQNTSLSDGATAHLITTCEAPTCPQPQNFAFTGSGSDFLSMAWTEMGTASSWNVAYGTTPMDSTFNTSNMTVVIVSDTTGATISNLSDSVYYVYVQADCGGESSIWVGPISQRPNTYVLAANANTSTTMCGGHIYDDGGADGVYSNNQSSTLVINPVDTLHGISITGTLWAENSSWDYLVIYAGEGTNGTELFTSNGASNSISTGMSVTAFNEGPVTLYFHTDGSVNGPGFDLTVSCFELGCDAVTDLQVYYTGSDSIIVNWNGNENAQQYKVKYSTQNFSFASDPVDSLYVNDTVAVLTGLTPNTVYYIGVASDCGASISNAQYVSQRTNCNQYQPVPYTTSFENDNTNGTPFCWVNPLNISYPYIYNYNGHSGSNSLYFYASSYSNTQNIIALPAMQGIDTLQIQFYAFASSYDIPDTFQVGVLETDNTFVPISNITLPTSYNASPFTVYFADYSGTGEKIAFRMTASDYGVVYLDDITVSAAPNCLPVSNVIATSDSTATVELTWDNNGSTAWEIVYDTLPITDFTNYTPLTVTTNPYTVGGLNPATNYYFYVRSNCGTEQSTWAMGTGSTLVCNDGCSVEIVMNDQYGDGWNGASIEVYQSGILLDNATIGTGYSATKTISVCPNAPISFNWVMGSYDGECSFDIYDAFDELIYTATDGSLLSGTFTTYTTTCQPPTCYRPSDLLVSQAGITSVTLTWTGNASNYEVNYYGTGGNDTSLYTNTNSITITGLDTLAAYNWMVRGICSATDTSTWSLVSSFSTTICDNAVIATTTNSGNHSTSYYFPANSCYNYSYTQTIIDSAEMAAVGGAEITAFQFEVEDEDGAGQALDSCMIYMTNDTNSVFDGAFLTVDSTWTLVYNGSLNISGNGWHTFMFDTTFVWDEHSNVVVAIARYDGDYICSVVFATTSCNGAKTVYEYDDYDAPDVTNPSSYPSTANYRANMNFIACGAGCGMPNVSVSSFDYQSATIVWSGNSDQYEVAVKAVNETTWPAETTVSNANTYTFTSLMPATQYTARVRQLCDSGAISDWGMVTFVTDSLPCFAPSNVEADAQGQQAVISWTAGGNEAEWTIHVFNTTFNQEYTATANPYTVTGLTANVTYNVAVSANCGGGLIQSDWSDTISFTTVPCDPVTNVAASNVMGTTATITWTAGENNTNSWEISWNYEGAGMTNMLGTATVSAATYDITGLTANTPYEVFVRAICAEGYNSDYATTTFTTQNVGIAHVEDGLNLSIFPNPATGNTTITLSGVNGNVTLSVVDMSGRTVQSTTMECSGDCEKSINVDNLAAGAYFVRVYGDNVNTVKKLIVK